MYKSLQIENFQSHKNSIVEFDKNVTAIVGLNNHGKSALLKALRKVVRDEPDGTNFISNVPDKASFMKITLLNNDNSYVIREVKRGLKEGDNCYKVVTSDDKEFDFHKFAKTGIPQEVLDVLDISQPQTFGNTLFDLNFQKQLDDLFLVSGDGLSSIRSKVLSKITGVDVVQRGIQVGKLKENDINKEMKSLSKQKQEFLTVLEKYTLLDEYAASAEKAFKKLDSLTTKASDISYYGQCKNYITYTQDKVISLKDLINQLSSFTEIEKVKVLQSKVRSCKKIFEVNQKLIKADRITSIYVDIDFDRLSNLFKIIDKARLASVHTFHIKKLGDFCSVKFPDTNKLKEQQKILEKFREVATKYEKLQSDQAVLLYVISANEKDLNKVNKEILDLKKELRVCPLCQKPF